MYNPQFDIERKRSTQGSLPWKAVVQGSLHELALQAVRHVADKLKDPVRSTEIAHLATEQSRERPNFKPYWTPFSIVYGDAALALFFGQMDRCFPNQDWDRIAHAYLVLAARNLESQNSGSHLFGGLSGLCFVTHFLSRNGTRYQRLLSTLEGLLLQQLTAIDRPHETFLQGVKFNDYDLFSGPTGVGAYLLLRQNIPGISTALDTIFDRLIFLSEEQNGQLRFFIPPELAATPQHRANSPQGATDCGLAHGVPGPLALLSLALLNGVERAGLQDAIRHLADWLVAQQIQDAWGVNWPYSVPPGDDALPSSWRSRTAWCYGSPGVARAIWLAGCALQDSDLKSLAVEAMQTVRQRPVEVRGVDGPILCHGVAGLLQVVMRFAHDTGQSFFVDMATELTQQLLSLFEVDSLTGFRNVEFDNNKTDNPGLLEGSAGVALALLAAATDVEPAWDRTFLLS